MSLKSSEEKVHSVKGAAKRVVEIEDEFRLAADSLTALRERAGVTQRELADHMGVSNHGSSQSRNREIEKRHDRCARRVCKSLLPTSSPTFCGTHTRSTGCARKIGVHDGLVGGVLVKVLDDDVGAHGGLFTGRLNP